MLQFGTKRSKILGYRRDLSKSADPKIVTVHF